MDDFLTFYWIGILTGILFCVGVLDPLADFVRAVKKAMHEERAVRTLRRQIHELNQTYRCRLARSIRGE
jgi:hypothetical protein